MSENAHVGAAAFRNVIDVANVLWPGSHAKVVSGRSGVVSRAAHRRQWLILPRADRARLLVPARLRGAWTMLDRQDHGARRPKLVYAASTAHRLGLLAATPLDRLELYDVGSGIEDELQKLLGKKIQVGVRLGRMRAHRSLVVQAFTPDGATAAFAKLGTTPDSSVALAREAANLRRVQELAPYGVRAPVVIHEGDWQGHPLLLLSPLAVLGRRRRRLADGAPVEAMNSLARAAGVPPASTSSEIFMDRLAQDLAGILERLPHATLLNAWHKLRSSGQIASMRYSCWHGDWAPWNMASDGEEVLLWDWEHFEEGVPAGFDALHYHAQRLRYQGRNDLAAAERTWSLGAPEVLQRAEVPTKLARATVVAYLLRINSRFLLEAQREMTTVRARVGWGLPLLEAQANGLPLPPAPERRGR